MQQGSLEDQRLPVGVYGGNVEIGAEVVRAVLFMQCLVD